MVARTIKGWGVEQLQGANFHGKPLTADQLDDASASLDSMSARLELGRLDVSACRPRPVEAQSCPQGGSNSSLPPFVEAMQSAGFGSAIDKKMLATRRAYGAALAALGDRQLTAAVDALQTRIDTGLWAPVGGDAPSGEQLIAEDLERLDRSRQALLRDLALLERSARRHESAGIALDEPVDLWPDDADLAGGRIEVFDARGNRIAQLSITGDDLERWLQASGVEPTETEGSDDG